MKKIFLTIILIICSFFLLNVNSKAIANSEQTDTGGGGSKICKYSNARGYYANAMNDYRSTSVYYNIDITITSKTAKVNYICSSGCNQINIKSHSYEVNKDTKEWIEYNGDSVIGNAKIFDWSECPKRADVLLQITHDADGNEKYMIVGSGLMLGYNYHTATSNLYLDTLKSNSGTGNVDFDDNYQHQIEENDEIMQNEEKVSNTYYVAGGTTTITVYQGKQTNNIYLRQGSKYVNITDRVLFHNTASTVASAFKKYKYMYTDNQSYYFGENCNIILSIDQKYKKYEANYSTDSGYKQCKAIAENFYTEDVKLTDNFCTKTASIWKFVGYGLYALKVAIPLVIIILGIIDFSKATVSNDDGAVKKAGKALIQRVIMGIMVFLTPTIIHIFLGIIPNSENNIGKCETCLLSPTSTECKE